MPPIDRLRTRAHMPSLFPLNWNRGPQKPASVFTRLCLRRTNPRLVPRDSAHPTVRTDLKKQHALLQVPNGRFLACRSLRTVGSGMSPATRRSLVKHYQKQLVTALRAGALEDGHTRTVRANTTRRCKSSCALLTLAAFADPFFEWPWSPGTEYL